MKALIVVDVQNDFLPGGAFAVPRGDEVIPLINALLPRFELVVATQDWHPPEHRSFASNHPGKNPGDLIKLAGLPQILWPDHCVQGTPGASFADELEVDALRKVFRKGTEIDIDSYSGFFDNGHRHSTGLGVFLSERSVERVFVCGLATENCVKFTALDAVRLGFQTSVIGDACRGVDLKPGDVERALAELRAAGVSIVRSEDL